MFKIGTKLIVVNTDSLPIHYYPIGTKVVVVDYRGSNNNDELKYVVSNSQHFLSGNRIPGEDSYTSFSHQIINEKSLAISEIEYNEQALPLLMKGDPF